MVAQFSGVRRPRAGLVRFRRLVAGGLAPALVAALAGCVATPRPAQPTVGADTALTSARSAYFSTTPPQPRKLPYMNVPDSLAGDSVIARWFETGRWAAKHVIQQEHGVLRDLAPTAARAAAQAAVPPLPRAAVAGYAAGFNKQYARERADRADAELAVVILLVSVGLLVLGIVAVIALIDYMSPLAAVFSMGLTSP